jgi:hypothetical protein
MGAGAGVRDAGSGGAAVFGRHAAGTGGRPAGDGAAAGGRCAAGCPFAAGARRPACACWPAVLRWSWVPGWSAPCWPGVVRCLRRPQRRSRVGAFAAAACPPAAATGPPAAGGGPAGAGAGPPGVAAGPPGVAAGPPGVAAGPPGVAAGPPGVAAGPPGVDVCLGTIGGRAVSRESRRVGGNSSGTAVSGSQGVSWPAHGSTGGVVAQSVGSSEGGSGGSGGSAGAGRRRDHQARFGSGGGTAAAPLQRAGACAVAGSVLRGSLPTSVGSALRRESSERPAAVVPFPALSSGSPAAGVASPGCWSAIRRSPPGAFLGRLSPG